MSTHEDLANRIIAALGNAFCSEPETKEVVDWNDLQTDWEDACESLHAKGVVLGLELAKSAWNKGLGLNDILQKIKEYSELIIEPETDVSKN